MPVLGSSEKPLGSVLAVENVVVPWPPACVNCWLNGEPTVPVFVTGLVTVMVWQWVVSVYGQVPVQPLVSVAMTVIGKTPCTVGVPARTPVDESSVMPAGSAPVSLQVTVPRMPLTLKVWLNAASTVPVLTPGLVTVMVWQLMVRL